MKNCPKCGRSYTDKTLNFCLEDGEWLLGNTDINEPVTAVLPDGISSPVKNPTERETKIYARGDFINNKVKRYKLRSGAIIGVVSLVLAGLGYGVYRSLDRSLSEPVSSSKGPVDHDKAYDYYLRGKIKVGSENPEDNEASIKLLEHAIAADPNYAEAYAALAQAYNVKAFLRVSGDEKKRLNEDAELAMERSLALNPNLAQGHFVRGLILWTPHKRFPHEQAIQSFKRAIALDPNFDEAHHRLAVVYFHIGLFDKAKEELDKTMAINPNNTLGRFRLGVIDGYRGHYEEALAVFKTIPRDASPSLVDRNIADVLFRLGRMEEATAVVEEYLAKYPTDEGGNVTSVKAMLLAKAGKEKEAEDAIQHAIEIGQGFGHFHHTAYNIASAYALLNKPDEAVKWLEAAADDGFPCYPYFDNDRTLDNIRQYHAFVGFMTKLKAQWEKRNASL